MMGSGRWKSFGKQLLIIGVLLWSVSPFLLDWPRITPSYFLDFITGMWPPDLSVLPALARPLGETLQMAVTATALGSIVAVPLALLGARNTAPHIMCCVLSRAIVATCRSIPSLLWAILLVVLLGLGPFTGVIALTIHSIGALGRRFYEAVEAMGPIAKEVLEAMRVDGANEAQVIWYGLLPLLAPLFAGYVVGRLDTNTRAGTALGLVGAGGIGLQLTTSIRMFRGHESLTIILAIAALVIGTDIFSQMARRRLITDSGV